MPLSKDQLINEVKAALSRSGHRITEITGNHPFDLLIQRPEGGDFQIRLYIWNITHGGQSRPSDEWRIQLYGRQGQSLELHPNPEIATAVLGWHDDFGIFAGWEAARYEGLMRSQSLQISEDSLRQAKRGGLIPYQKGGDSGVATAIHPESLGRYLDTGLGNRSISPSEEESRVHDLFSADLSLDFSFLDEVNDKIPGPYARGGSDLGQRKPAPPPKRRNRREVTHLELDRASDFDSRVYEAYGYQCAFTGVGLRLQQAAHVIPVNDPASNDETCNGIALSPTYHAAYDRGLITFDLDGTIYVDYATLQQMSAEGVMGDVRAFLSPLRSHAQFPDAVEDRPHPDYINHANRRRGWEDRQPVAVLKLKRRLGQV